MREDEGCSISSFNIIFTFTEWSGMSVTVYLQTSLFSLCRQLAKRLTVPYHCFHHLVSYHICSSGMIKFAGAAFAEASISLMDCWTKDGPDCCVFIDSARVPECD